jgi:hypothetical protein
MQIKLAQPTEIPKKMYEKLEKLHDHLWDKRTKIYEKDHPKIVKEVETYMQKNVPMPDGYCYEVTYSTVLGYLVNIYKIVKPKSHEPADSNSGKSKKLRGSSGTSQTEEREVEEAFHEELPELALQESPED